MLHTVTRLSLAALALTFAFSLTFSPGAAIADDRTENAQVVPDIASDIPVAPDRAALPPIVSFSRSSSGWTANFSFADPVTEIQWSLDKDAPIESTGLLPTYDPRTRRPMANPALDVDADATAIYLRYADVQGHWVGPIAIPLDPAVEIKRFYRSILEMTAGAWLAFRHDARHLLYYSHISGYRCAIAEFRVGIDKPAPNRVVALAPCDVRDPGGTPADVDMTIKIDPSVTFASAQLVYRDGTVSKVKIFRR